MNYEMRMNRFVFVIKCNLFVLDKEMFLDHGQHNFNFDIKQGPEIVPK